MLGEVGVDTPVAHRVGVGHRVARNARAAKTQPVEFGRLRPQTSLDVPQTFPPRQLSKRKTAKLIEAREAFDLALTVIAIHAATERRQRQVNHDLRKDELALR